MDVILATEEAKIKPQIELMGEEIRIVELKVDIETLVPVHIEIIELWKGR